jgi:hypothetical protein
MCINTYLQIQVTFKVFGPDFVRFRLLRAATRDAAFYKLGVNVNRAVCMYGLDIRILYRDSPKHTHTRSRRHGHMLQNAHTDFFS